MPSSRKGRRQRITRQPVPISPLLAARLRQSVIDRKPTDPLLTKADRTPWNASSHLRLFRRMAAAIDLDAGVTFYSLRNSSIVRQLLAERAGAGGRHLDRGDGADLCAIHIHRQ
jgi:hypothetical protein